LEVEGRSRGGGAKGKVKVYMDYNFRANLDEMLSNVLDGKKMSNYLKKIY
jgi:hypothetical protein